MSGDYSAYTDYRKWMLPPTDQIEKMSQKDLRDVVHALIEHAERGDANRLGGGVELAIIRAQYLNQELTRRDEELTRWRQDRQTRAIVRMTAFITVMTLVIMVATISPQWVQSTSQSIYDFISSLLVRSISHLAWPPWRP